MKYLNIIFLTLISLHLFAGSPIVNVGYSFNGIRNPTFEIFRKSYNAYEAAGIKVPLAKLNNSKSMSYAIGWNANGFYSTIGRTSYTATSQAIGITGDKRTFDYKSKSTWWEVGMLSSLNVDDKKSKKFGWGGGICFAYNNITLHSSYTSPTGFQDFGTGSRLNGIFRGSDMDYLLMVQTGINLYKGIALIGKAYYNVTNYSLNTSALVDHQQDDQVQLHNPSWIRIPTNYEEAIKYDLDTRLIFPKDGSLLQTNMNQYHMQVSLYIPIAKNLFTSKK